MYNRYQGNTGQVRRVDDGRPRERPPAGGCPAPPPAKQTPPRPAPHRQPGLMEQLGQLLPGSREPLETEDLILLLILYLMYRESGDSELLMIMGGMFLL